MSEGKVNILLAEPSELLRKVVKERLQLEGYKVKTVSDGLELEDVIQKNHFDVLIVEELLPFKNGFEILKSANVKKIPTIIISDADLEKKIVEAFDLGASDFIDKPFSPNEVVARVKNIIRKKNI